MTITETPLFDRMIKVLVSLPSPEEVLALKMTEEESERIDYLIARKKEGTITPKEWQEAQDYIQTERYVQMAKAKALAKIRNKQAA